MPRYSPVHYETLEAEAATRKTASAAARRRRQGSPKENELALNAYNIGRALTNLSTTLTSLAEEHQTLSHESAAGIDAAALQRAAELVALAAEELSKSSPTNEELLN